MAADEKGARVRRMTVPPNRDGSDWTPRVFGQFEAEAMFQNLDGPGIDELEAERELLLACRSALRALLRACGSENFNSTGQRAMSANLRAAIRQAEQALEDA